MNELMQESPILCMLVLYSPIILAVIVCSLITVARHLKNHEACKPEPKDKDDA